MSIVFDEDMSDFPLHAPQKLPLSVVIITLNEEKNLPRCLASVPFASEFFVLDSGSTDQTLSVARKLGAQVCEEPWKGFGAQKHSAVRQAQYPWVLCLDADEELSPELAEEILKKFSQLQPQVGYKIPRLSFYLGRWIRHGGWYPDYQLRLFHRDHHQWALSTIHESVHAEKTEKLEHPMRHFVFRDIAHQIQTNNRYSSLQAEAAFAKGQGFSWMKLIFKPWSKFLECYLWKRGFLDGFPGFFIAVGAAYSVFLRHGKIWELESRSQNSLRGPG